MDRCNAEFPRGSILGIFFSDLADGLSSNAKLFADDTSLFSVIHDVDTSANELNNDLYQINKWAFHWKIRFNPDSSKQAQEIIFNIKTKKICHLSLRYNSSIASQSTYQSTLAYFLIHN